MYPRIVVDTKKLKHNMDALIAMGHEQGISIGLVSKCVCAHAPIIELMNQTEADFIADSRLLNLKNMQEHTLYGQKEQITGVTVQNQHKKYLLK